MAYRLTERRAKDRQTLATEVLALAAQFPLWRASYEEMGPRELWVTLTGPHGLSVTLDFDGESTQPDNYCLAWHFNSLDPSGNAVKGPVVKLSAAFGRYQGSTISPFHGRKCTAFAAGVDTLLDKLKAAMEMASGTSPYGSAFVEAE